MYKSKTGFTLLELTIVIVILGTISVASIFTVGNYISDAQIDIDTGKIVQILRTAYSNSVSELYGQNWGVHFNEGQNTYTLFAGTDYTSRVVEHDTVFTIDDSLEFYELDFYSGNDYVIFNKNTGHINSDASFTVREKNGNISVDILINTYGQINIKK